MDYKVVMTTDAEADLDRCLKCLVENKGNPQAASNVLDDFETTKAILSTVAGSLKLCENPKLNKLGYRRINFLHHNYFLLYRLEGNLVIVDAISHFLEDFENKMK